jgi:hypothetical protein
MKSNRVPGGGSAAGRPVPARGAAARHPSSSSNVARSRPVASAARHRLAAARHDADRHHLQSAARRRPSGRGPNSAARSRRCGGRRRLWRSIPSMRSAPASTAVDSMVSAFAAVFGDRRQPGRSGGRRSTHGEREEMRGRESGGGGLGGEPTQARPCRVNLAGLS